jgi:hypothetical protein
MLEVVKEGTKNLKLELGQTKVLNRLDALQDLL